MCESSSQRMSGLLDEIGRRMPEMPDHVIERWLHQPDRLETVLRKMLLSSDIVHEYNNVQVNYDSDLSIESQNPEIGMLQPYFKPRPQDVRSGIASVTISLVHLDYRVPFVQDAYGEILKMGFRPADIYELVGLRAVLTEEDREYVIAALGSVRMVEGGFLLFPYHNGYSKTKEISFDESKVPLLGLWRFAVVHELR